MTLDFAEEVVRALRVSSAAHLSREELVGAVLALADALENERDEWQNLLEQAE